MDITERKNYYEKVYFYELDRRSKIHMEIRLPIAILTYMASVNFFLITEVFALGSESSIKLVMASIFTTISVCILAYLLRCIYRALIGWVYHEVSLEDFEKYHKELTEYYKEYYVIDHDEQKLALMVRETLEKNLAQQFMECADYNHNLNLEREGYINRSIQGLPFYLFSLTLSYIFISIYTPTSW